MPRITLKSLSQALDGHKGTIELLRKELAASQATEKAMVEQFKLMSSKINELRQDKEQLFRALLLLCQK